MTNVRQGLRFFFEVVGSPSRRWGFYNEYPFGLARAIEDRLEIPACRGPEVLPLFIEVNPIAGKESERYP